MSKYLLENVKSFNYFLIKNLLIIRGKTRGPDYENPDNININDVLGDFSLTLVDSLDMLAIIGTACPM